MSATVTVTYDSPEYHAEQTFTITVQPKAVTVKADDKSRAYGEANPELTWSVQDGFSLVGQDTLNLTISTTAVSESVPGSYPITLTEVEGANPNYTVTTQDGTLTTNGLYAQNISLHQHRKHFGIPAGIQSEPVPYTGTHKRRSGHAERHFSGAAQRGRQRHGAV